MTTVMFFLLLGVLSYWFVRQWVIPTAPPEWNAALIQVAEKYQAEIHDDSKGYSYAYFFYGDGQPTDVLVRCVRRWDGCHTETVMRWPSLEFFLSITAGGVSSAHPVSQAVRYFRANDPILCRYHIWTNNVQETGRLLTEALKYQLENLRQCLPGAGFELRVEQGNFCIRKACLMKNADALEAFVRVALNCWEELREASVGDVARDVQLTATHYTAGSRCPVCREWVFRHSAESVICPDCQTTHHADCWQFNGGCGVYGCG